MPTYSFKAVNLQGAAVNGELHAMHPEDVVSKLKAQKLYPLDIREATGHKTKNKNVFSQQIYVRSKLDQNSIKDFLKQLSLLLEAGVPLSKAINLVGVKSRHQKIFTAIGESLAQGQSFSDTVSQNGIALTSDLQTIIASNERIGKLETGLASAADIIEKRLALRAEINSMLVYPVILMILAVISFAIVLIFLVPSLAPVFEGSGVEMPGIMQAILAFSNSLTNYGPLYIAGLIMIIMVGLGCWYTQYGRALSIGLLTRLPYTGNLLRKLEMSRFSRIMASLLDGGVSMPEAIDRAGESCFSTSSRGAVAQALEQLKQGRSISDCLGSLSFFDNIARQLIQAGEASNRLGEILHYIAQSSEMQLQLKTKRIMTILPPALIVLIGIFIGGLILSVMQAITSLNAIIT